MGAQLPPDVIDDARATDLVLLVESYGVKMHKQGKDFFGLCPFHSEDTPSFTIYSKNAGPQRFHCMGCGADGDAIQFVQSFEGLKFRDAVRRLVGNLPATGNAPTPAAAHVPAEPEEVWTPVLPIPDSAPMTPDTIRRKIKGQWVSVKASRRWDYRDANGDVLGYVFRFDMPGGGKEVLPLVWAVSSLTGEMQWRWMSFPKPRPLYGLDKLAENPNALVMLVEGEKAADAAQDLFIANGLPMQDLVVVSWPGGGKAVRHVDFAPLKGRAVALWPDADQKPYPANHERAGVTMPFLEQPGTVAMLDAWAAIRETAARVRVILPPANVPDGWDLADPAPPGFDLRRHIKHNTMHADAVERRFSLVPSLSADDTVIPIWFVPALSPAELRRAAFAAEVVAFSTPGLGGRIDPRGVQLRPFAGVDGLRAALKEARQLLPAAHLRVLLPAELGDEGVEVAEAAGASVEALQPGECWVDNVWRAAGLQEPVGEAGDDEHEDALRVTVEPAVAPERAPDPADHDDDVARRAGFLVLGFDRDGSIFIYSHERRQVITTNLQRLSREAGLIELADLAWWEANFAVPGKDLKTKAAVNWIARIAGRRGVYEVDRIRGRGAWLDDGRLVFHLGDKLVVDGDLREIDSLTGSFVYEARPRIDAPSAAPLSCHEGEDLLRIARMFRWAQSGAAELLAGWLFLAPICGVLRWRPHVWIGAAPGAGKSTLMDSFVSPLLPDRWALHELGLTTEAALRQKLGVDALPVLLDEFEANTEADRRRIEGVLTLIRLSSSSGEISRGTPSGRALTFTARSMFLLASVGVGLHRQTDEDRITRLEILKNGGGPDRWPELEAELRRLTRDRSISQRLFARALDRLVLVQEAVDVFTREAGDMLQSQRHGDQYGTLLAGCWCLTHDVAPTAAEARAKIAQYELAEFGAGASASGDDSSNALNAVLSSVIRVDGGRSLTVSQLIEVASMPTGYDENPSGLLGVSRKDADHQLQLHGIRVQPQSGSGEDAAVLFAAAHRQLNSLVADSDFATDLIGRLARLPGAWKSREGKPRAKVRFAGASLRYVSVPLELCVSAEEDAGSVVGSSMPRQGCVVPAPF